MDAMQLTLNSLALPVECVAVEGRLYADIGESPQWSIDIHCRKHLFADDYPPIALRFYDESLRLRLDDWTALAGRVIRFDLETGENEDGGGPTLYFCSHLFLPRSELRFGARGGGGFTFSWEGRADANFDPSFGKDMPFSISGHIPFQHMEIRFQTDGDAGGYEAAARTLMDAHGLRHDNLRFGDARWFADDPDLHLIRTFFLPDA